MSRVSGVPEQGELPDRAIKQEPDFGPPPSELAEPGLRATALAASRAALLAEARQLTLRCSELPPPDERELAIMLHQLRLARLGRSQEQAGIFSAYQQLYAQGWLRYLVSEAVADWLAAQGEYSAFSARTLLMWMQQQWPRAGVLTTARYEQAVSSALVELAGVGVVRAVNAGDNFTQMYTAG